MDEAETVNSEITQVAPDLNAETTQEQPSHESQEQPAEQKQNRHFKEMRRRNADLERQVKMQEELLERVLKTQQAPSPPQEIDELDQIDDSEVIHKGQVKKLVRKQAEAIANEIVDKKMAQVEQRNSQATTHTRLRGHFSDFDEIVNQDSLALLEEQEPELALTIAESKDPYKILYQSYKFIKKLGIDKDVPNARHAKEVEKKIEKTSKTVQSPQAHDKRPMAQAFRMTEGMRKELAEEMNFYARQASSVPEMG